MSVFQQLNELTESYIEKSRSALAGAGLFDGAFGLGNDPRRNPCHEEYYNDCEKALKELQTESEDACFEALSYIIHLATDTECPSMCTYMFDAVQGLAIPYVSLLSDEHRSVLAKWFDDNIPKRTRFPVQKQLYKLLSR